MSHRATTGLEGVGHTRTPDSVRKRSSSGPLRHPCWELEPGSLGTTASCDTPPPRPGSR